RNVRSPSNRAETCGEIPCAISCVGSSSRRVSVTILSSGTAKTQHRAAVRSVCAAHRQNRGNCPSQNFEIEQEAPLTRVCAVVLHSLLVIDITSSVHLPKPCDSRAEEIVIGEILAVKASFSFDNRSGPHERHLSGEHIEKLWQLIDTQSPNNAA